MIGLQALHALHLGSGLPQVLCTEPTYEFLTFIFHISGHPRVVLGVDRLDYTKGLVSRLKSFRRLLEKYPKWIEKVILLQVQQPLFSHHLFFRRWPCLPGLR